jgi:hypothetical protein
MAGSFHLFLGVCFLGGRTVLGALEAELIDLIDRDHGGWFDQEGARVRVEVLVGAQRSLERDYAIAAEIGVPLGEVAIQAR